MWHQRRREQTVQAQVSNHMYIKRITITNFRALKQVEIPLARSTVLIGENNSGKSSVLDCIYLVLSRRWGQGGTGFADYDLTISDDSLESQLAEPDTEDRTGTADNATDKHPPKVSIELLFSEETVNEWPDEIKTVLFGIVRTDPISCLNSIVLRVTYTFNPLERNYEPGWAFIDINGDPIGTSEAKRAINTYQFFKYVPVFFLSALRDSSKEFSTRSQFWGRLLKAVEISPEERHALDNAIEELNARLLAADPRVSQTVERLKEIQTVVAHGAVQDVSIRALPMKVWELLSRSEIVIKGEVGSPWLPLDRHGQGVKSLSVIYLFNAFVERLLKEAYSEHSEPILALEEPEVHLHPQAARALWAQIDTISGQKIITSHSPYFVQFVPIKDVRLLRRGPNGVQVHYVSDSVSVELPSNSDIISFAKRYSDRFSYDDTRGILSANGPIDEVRCRELMKCFTTDDTRVHHTAIRDFKDESHHVLESKDLEDLEDWARRIRGEIFFSRLWVLCEGQSEVFLLTALFNAYNYNLDSHGVSLIDYQNCGSARAFACLARTFHFPWLLFCDGDQHGKSTISSLENAAFSSDDMEARVISLPDGEDLEGHISKSPLRALALEVAKEFDTSLIDNVSDEELASALRCKKPIWARRLGDKLMKNPPNSEGISEPLNRIRQMVIDHGIGNGSASKT